MQSCQLTKRSPTKLATKLMQWKENNAKKEVVNQLFANGRKCCFITYKDYKPHILNNPKVR